MVEWDYFENIISIIDVKQVAENIMSEVIDFSTENNSKSAIIQSKSKQLITAQAEYEYIMNLIFLLRCYSDEDVLKELSKYGYSIREKSLIEDLNKAERKAGQRLTKIGIIKADLKDMITDGGGTIEEEINSIIRGCNISMSDYNQMSTKQYMILKYSAIKEANRKELRNGR
jgi:hypothetical protein